MYTFQQKIFFSAGNPNLSASLNQKMLASIFLSEPPLPLPLCRAFGETQVEARLIKIKMFKHFVLKLVQADNLVGDRIGLGALFFSKAKERAIKFSCAVSLSLLKYFC